MSEPNSPANAAAVAEQLAEQFDLRGQNYALGGAIALGYWALPGGRSMLTSRFFCLPNVRPSASGSCRRSVAISLPRKPPNRCASTASAVLPSAECA